MVVLRPQSEPGHAPLPQTPYSIVTNLRGWELGKRFRDGDRSALANVVHIYPRFAPTHYVKQLGEEIVKKLGVEGKGAMIYLNPEMWPFTRRNISNEHREKRVLKVDDIELRCVDIGGHRLYVVLFLPQQTAGVILSWTTPGLGVSIRGAEQLLMGVDDLCEVPFAAFDDPPPPTWTPETEAHRGIKERIRALMHRASINSEAVTCSPEDVFLYPTGMAAVFHSTNLLLRHRPGTIVLSGVPFHSTYHHLLEECPYGLKHFGKVDDEGLDAMEAWLEVEAKEGRPVAYVFVEIPGNPTLDTPDLPRMKKLSEKCGFVLLVDDTVGSIANVDCLAQCDLVLTSLTKSFSGQANVMGGSVVLNPQSPHYASLAPLFASSHHNELFAPDAGVILANSLDLLPRTARLNRNAQAMARYLHSTISDPESPVVHVRYPSLLPSKVNYDRVLRRPTPELPEPGHGCLFSVDFESIDTAAAFYDHCGFYPSPHLGGHVTIMLCYNMLAFSKKPEERAYMRKLGVKEEGIRISAGLEDEQDLIDTLKEGLKAAKEVKKIGIRKDMS